MARKLALVLAACLGLWHGTAYGLGLGEISVDSALNQPFAATIELRNSENLERNEIIANLASSEDFDRIGVERFFFLSDLAFATDLTDPDRPIIRITSNQPVTEPFVNFVVEVLWPSGRLLKEFTILLDPPTYAARPLTPPRAPAAAPAPGRIRTTPATASAAPAAREGPGIGSLMGDTYGVTDRNDTLWDIALKVRPQASKASASVHQTMLALLRLNPEAFIGRNINQLKAGYVLRVPSLEEIQRLSYQDAVVQVAEQNDRWRAGLDRAPLDARQAVAEARTSGSDAGELRLVSAAPTAAPTAASAGERAAGGAGRDAGSGDPAAAAQLTATQTQLGTAQRQNAALQSQLQGRATELEELQRQIQVRDEQIARLQQAVTQQMQTQGSAPAPAPQASSSAAAGGLFGFSWLVIGAIVAGLVLIGVIILLVLRRLSSSGEEVTVFEDDEIEADVEKTQLMPALTAADLGAATPSSDEEADVGEDVLAEADVYMAYGNFSEAAAALSSALESDPNRADIRLKLLEVFVEQGDVDAFNEQTFALQGFADEATIAEADRLAVRLPGAATSSGEITSGDAVAPSRDASDGEVSLDFDLAMDGDGGADAEAPADLDSLDIDLDLGDDAASDDGGAGIDFDLDLDGDDDASALDLGDDELALDVDGDEPVGGDFELSLEDDGEDEGGALPDIDFEMEEVAEASIAADDDGDDDGDLDFDIDTLDDGDADKPAVGVSSESADDFQDRTVILGGDDLELALEAEGADEDDGFEFDIDDLAKPETPIEAAAAPASADELDLGDEALALDADDADLGDIELELAAAAEETTDDADVTELLSPDAGGLDSELDFEIDEDFDFGDEDDADEISTKLELARAYVDMGDEDGAKEILDEVVRDGDDGQKKEAGELLVQIG